MRNGCLHREPRRHHDDLAALRRPARRLHADDLARARLLGHDAGLVLRDPRLLLRCPYLLARGLDLLANLLPDLRAELLAGLRILEDDRYVEHGILSLLAPKRRRRTYPPATHASPYGTGAARVSTGEPLRRPASHLGGHGVRTVELPVVHLVARAPQPGDEPSAAPINWEHRVGHAVRHENARRAVA